MNGRAPLTIALVAGETSGDRLGAELMRALAAERPGVRCFGMAGPAMRAAGCTVLARSEELSVMGLAEVVTSYPRLYRLRARLVDAIVAARPAVLVGIDVPDFNLGLERRVKACGIPTVHYVCPQLWAWRQGRAAGLYRAADRLLAVLPFEPAFFNRHGVATTFVGHPLADTLPLEPDRPAARAALGLSAAVPLLAVMPGSRDQELARLLPDFIACARRLCARHDALRAVFCVAHASQLARLEATLATLAPGLPHHVFHAESHQVLTACDVALVASGTVSLEALLCATPMVVAYRLSSISYPIIRRMVKIPHIALPNILAGEALVPELLQDAITPDALSAAVEAWLEQPSRRAAFVGTSRRLHAELRGDAAGRAARAVLELCPT